MKNKQNIKFILMTMLFISIILIASKVNAASLSISASKSSATVGESVNITVTGNDIEGEISFSSSGASLSAPSVYVNNNSATITAKMDVAGTVNISAKAINVKALSESDSTFSDEKTCSITVAEKAPEIPTPAPTTQENQNEEPEEEKKSNDANLQNLGIRPHDFKGFKAGKLSYDAEVPNDVEEIEVYAESHDPKAKVEGIGTKKLKLGKNAFQVVVTAEDDKTKKTYTINVTRKEAEAVTEENTTEEQVTENNEQPIIKDLTKLEVEGFNISPAFSPDVYEYTLTVKKDVTQLNIITEGASDNVSIEVVGNTDLQEGENIVTILVSNTETEQTDTYQIIVNKTNEEEAVAGTEVNEAMLKARKIRYIIIGVFVLVVVCAVAVLILRRKFAGRENYFDDTYDDDEMYYNKKQDKINLSDEDELFNRVNKNDFYKKNTETQYIPKKRKESISLEDRKKEEKDELENEVREIRRKREQNRQLEDERLAIKREPNKQFEDERLAIRRERQIKKDVQDELNDFRKPKQKSVDFNKSYRDDFIVQPTKKENIELKENKKVTEDKSSDLDNFYAMDNLEEFLRAQKEKNRK